MGKEPFDRTKPHVNIGKIGETSTQEEMRRAVDTIAFVMQNGEEYNQELLAKLISTYGEEEGKRIFNQMILQAQEMNDTMQNIGDDIESKIR